MRPLPQYPALCGCGCLRHRLGLQGCRGMQLLRTWHPRGSHPRGIPVAPVAKSLRGGQSCEDVGAVGVLWSRAWFQHPKAAVDG